MSSAALVQPDDDDLRKIKMPPDPAAERTAIVFVLDASGSMEGVRKDTIGGFNSFVAEQRAQGSNASLTLFMFSYLSRKVYEDVGLALVPELTDRTYVPSGGTALYDAVVDGGAALTRMLSEDPSYTGAVFVVLTDGEENSSLRADLQAVRATLSSLRERGYLVLFLGADMDAIAAGANLGVQADQSIAFAQGNVSPVMAYASESVAAYRTTREVRGFGAAVRAQAVDRSTTAEQAWDRSGNPTFAPQVAARQAAQALAQGAPGAPAEGASLGEAAAVAGARPQAAPGGKRKGRVRR